MRTFDPSGRCPKCGNDGISTKLLTECGQNRLRRVCLRCDCKWDETPLDYEADKEFEAMKEHKENEKKVRKGLSGLPYWHLCNILP